MYNYTKINELSKKIEFYKAHKGKFQHRYSGIDPDAENSWGASFLFSKILHASEAQQYQHLTLETANQILQKFNLENNATVKIRELQMRGWLNVVFGLAYVPNSVAYTARKTIDFSSYIQEYGFFRTLTMPMEGFKEENLRILASDYETKNNVQLNLDLAKNKLWSIDEKGKIKLFGLDFHKLMHECLSEFLYLHELYRASYEGDESKIQINEVDLNRILSTHRSYFPACPDLCFFEENEVVIPHNDKTYVIEINKIKTSYNDSVFDKIAALLWNAVMADDSFSTDQQRLFFWYLRTAYKDYNCEIVSHLANPNKDRFLNACFEAVEQDKDLGNGSLEYRKLRLASEHHHYSHLLHDYKVDDSDIEFSLSEDYFELFDELNSRRNEFNEYMTFDARNAISYFVSNLVQFDHESRYKFTRQLLALGIQKPYLFWITCHRIYYWNPEIIPSMVTWSDAEALTFLLISKIEISRELGADAISVKNELLLETFTLLVNSLNINPQATDPSKVRILGQCLIKSAFRKFKVYRVNKTDDNKRDVKMRVDITCKIREAFDSAVLPGIVHSPLAKYQLPVYLQLLPDLFTFLKAYNKKGGLSNGFIDIPSAKLDMLAYLLELTDKKTHGDKPAYLPRLRNEICEEFISLYMDAMNCQEILKIDYFGDNTLKPAIPSWSTDRTNDNLIPWTNVILALQEENCLDDLLTPVKLIFNKNNDEYDPLNRFTAHKLRTHLAILLNCYIELSKEALVYKVSTRPYKQALYALENRITSYVTKYCTFNHQQKRFDLFNDSMERGLWGGTEAELLPLIGNTLNRFKKENKKCIIKGLMDSKELVRALKLLEYVAGEDERSFILSVIKSYPINDFLKEVSFYDLQYVVSNLSVDPEFLDQAKASLKYVENKIKGRSSHYDKDKDLIFLFRTRLLLAYYTKVNHAIDEVEAPNLNSYISNEFSAESERDFYKALLFLDQNNPQQAYLIFHRLLTYSKDNRPVLALNRFASKLRWAYQQEDSQQKASMFRESLEEWIGFEENSTPEKWQLVKHNVLYNKLAVNEGLTNDMEFDMIFADLEPNLRLRSDFLELRLTSLMRRKMHSQAEALLLEAEEFHMLDNYIYPDFINKLQQIVSPKETLDFLQKQYQRIFQNSPEHLVQIIPDNINKHNNLQEFILQEIVNSANDVLRLVNSIIMIDHEDKYSDLIMLALNSRFINFGWSVSGIRSGQSDSVDDSINPGLIDFAIHGPNKQVLAICEALRLWGKNSIETQKHALKIFNYDSQRKLFYLISYYEGKSSNFKKSWKSYCQVIENFITFPEAFSMISKNVLSLSDLENDSVKVGKTEHGDSCNVYHIFININYKTELTIKKVGVDGSTTTQQKII